MYRYSSRTSPHRRGVGIERIYRVSLAVGVGSFGYCMTDVRREDL